MKRLMTVFAILVLVFALSACVSKTEKQASTEDQIPNPWHSFETLKSAEEYAGYELGIPETIADTYKAVSYSVMDGEKTILQVHYQDEDFEVIIRKSRDVGQDISGVYGFTKTDISEYEGTMIQFYRPSDKSETPNAVLNIFDYNGFAWSIYAQNGFWGDSGRDFLIAVFEE